MVSKRMLGLGTARSVIRELFEYGNQRAAVVGRENVYDFSLGNPSVPAPDAVNEAAIRILREQPELIHCYTSAQGDAAARQRFADSLNRRFGGDYTADQLYITVGAAASLCCVFHGLTCPGDEFIVFAPYFPEYKVFIEGAGAKMVLIPPEIEHFQIDFAAFERALTPHTKGVVVNSPNNPSGVVYSAQTLTRLAEVLERKSREFGHRIYLVSDEPYRDIVFDGGTAPYPAAFYPHTLTCFSYSKSLSIPGERLGYAAVCPGCEGEDVLVDMMAQISRFTGHNCPPSLLQRAVAQCQGVTSDLAVYQTNMELLYDALTRLGFEVQRPGGTFYIFPKALEPDAAAFCRKAREFDLLLVPSDSFGVPGYVRLAYCIDTDKVRRSLPALEQLANAYR